MMGEGLFLGRGNRSEQTKTYRKTEFWCVSKLPSTESNDCDVT